MCAFSVSALRVSRAVTRLTVHRAPQHYCGSIQKKIGQIRWNHAVNEWKHILSYFSPLCMLWCVWLVGSFIWLVGCIGGLVGQLVGWFGWVDWLAGWLGLVGWIVACLFAWLIACLLVDWLIGWLVGCGVVDLILFVSALRVPRAVTRLTVYRN